MTTKLYVSRRALSSTSKSNSIHHYYHRHSSSSLISSYSSSSFLWSSSLQEKKQQPYRITSISISSKLSKGLIGNQFHGSYNSSNEIIQILQRRMGTLVKEEEESSAHSIRKKNMKEEDAVIVTTKMKLPRLYQYLQVTTFNDEELETIFNRIQNFGSSSRSSGNTDEDTIGKEEITAFLMTRMEDIFSQQNNQNNNHDDNPPIPPQDILHSYASTEAVKFLNLFHQPQQEENVRITKSNFISTIKSNATSIDIKRLLPISLSMLLVGSSVGIVTPIMPFVVQNLGLSPGQYGMVISAFALAKMIGNVPSAVLVERHGRKPYMVNSLPVLAIGVAGIGLATQFEHLFLCRLLTGFGVAALSTAATMTIADISTPLNRASTMGPIMASFSAGMAFGPAVGGFLADHIGIGPTFYVVGASYLGLTLLNRFLLEETQPSPTVPFPWTHQNKNNNNNNNDSSILSAVQDAFQQWIPLMSNENDHGNKVRTVVIMNGFYWMALSGAQMTLLPLILTNPSGLALSASSVGQVYMGMSLVNVLSNPLLSPLVDRIGKVPAMITGCTFLTTSMTLLPLVSSTATADNGLIPLGAVLGIWSLGSTILSTAPVSYISDTIQTEKRAQAIALLRTSGDIGFFIGAIGTGMVADMMKGNLDFAMYSAAGVLFTATGWFATTRKQLMTMTTTAAARTPTTTKKIL